MCAAAQTARRSCRWRSARCGRPRPAPICNACPAARGSAGRPVGPPRQRAGDLGLFAAHHVRSGVGRIEQHAGGDQDRVAARSRNAHRPRRQGRDAGRARHVRRLEPALRAADHAAGGDRQARPGASQSPASSASARSKPAAPGCGRCWMPYADWRVSITSPPAIRKPRRLEVPQSSASSAGSGVMFDDAGSDGRALLLQPGIVRVAVDLQADGSMRRPPRTAERGARLAPAGSPRPRPGASVRVPAIFRRCKRRPGRSNAVPRCGTRRRSGARARAGHMASPVDAAGRVASRRHRSGIAGFRIDRHLANTGAAQTRASGLPRGRRHRLRTRAVARRVICCATTRALAPLEKRVHAKGIAPGRAGLVQTRVPVALAASTATLGGPARRLPHEQPTTMSPRANCRRFGLPTDQPTQDEGDAGQSPRTGSSHDARIVCAARASLCSVVGSQQPARSPVTRSQQRRRDRIGGADSARIGGAGTVVVGDMRPPFELWLSAVAAVSTVCLCRRGRTPPREGNRHVFAGGTACRLAMPEHLPSAHRVQERRRRTSSKAALQPVDRTEVHLRRDHRGNPDDPCFLTDWLGRDGSQARRRRDVDGCDGAYFCTMQIGL